MDQTINGVPGTNSGTTWKSEKRGIDERCRMQVAVRFFSIGQQAPHLSATATIWQYEKTAATGVMNDEIRTHFPELAPLLPWHLCSTKGPLHYIENTVHHASNRDAYGRLAGEPCAWTDAVQFGTNPIKHPLKAAFSVFLQENGPPSNYDFEVVALSHRDRGQPGKTQFADKFTFVGFANVWHEAPFDHEARALDFLEALREHDPVYTRNRPAKIEEGQLGFLGHAPDEEISARLARDAQARTCTWAPSILRSRRRDSSRSPAPSPWRSRHRRRCRRANAARGRGRSGRAGGR